MKIVFISNYFNHHQKPLSDALSHKSEEFMFVSTSVMREERVRLGYQNVEASYVVHTDDDKGRFLAEQAVGEYDAVIFGSAPESLVSDRIKDKKIIFRYSERPFKEFSFLKYFPRRVKWGKRVPFSSNIFLLCAGAYTAADYAKLGLFKNKAFKWGYFPSTKRYDDIGGLIKRKKPNSILWVGRFLDWKHPELAVEAARFLKQQKLSFSLEMIGTGDLEEETKKLVERYDLCDCVSFTGAMTPEEVRAHMEESEILLFSSDKQEGWGAVLNEAMNSGCAVVASHSIGAVPYLINDGENGMIFESLNSEMMFEKLLELMRGSELRRKLGMNAYTTITESWNADEAAERFIRINECIQNGDDPFSLYDEGPCSKAEIINDKYIKGSK